MPYQAIHSATNGLSTIVQTIAVPREHRALRIPSFPALERTSLLSFTDTFGLQEEPGEPTLEYFALIRDPVFPLWRRMGNDGLGHSVFRKTITAAVALPPGQEYQVATDYAQYLYSSTTGSWPCAALPMYVYGGKEYTPSLNARLAVELLFDVDPGVMTVELGGTLLTRGLDPLPFIFAGVPIVQLISGGWRAAYVVSLPVDSFAFHVHSILLTNTVLCTLNMTYVGSTTSDQANSEPLTVPRPVVPWHAMLPLTQPTEYSSAPVVWQSTRANSVAALFTNVSAVLQKEGTVNAARVSSETGTSMFGYEDWSSAFAGIHPKERYYGPLEKGLYTFTLPDAVSETYHEYDNIGGADPRGTFPAYKHYLDGNRYAHLMIMKAPDYTTAFAITVDRHVEFKTSSVLFPYGFSSTPLEHYHQAQMALANLGVFYENPTHLGTIAALARAAAVKYGPTIMRAALPYAVTGANKLLATINNKLGVMKQAGFTSKKEKPSQKKKMTKRAPKRTAKRR